MGVGGLEGWGGLGDWGVGQTISSPNICIKLHENEMIWTNRDVSCVVIFSRGSAENLNFFQKRGLGSQYAIQAT